MTDHPRSGGSYVRDPKTGALTRRADHPPATPADDAAPVKPTTSSKEGK